MAWFYKDMAKGSQWRIEVFDSLPAAEKWIASCKQAKYNG
jgi:hypothetical protein